MYHVQVALALLQKCEKQLLPMIDMEDIVHYLKAEVASPSCKAHQCCQDAGPLLGFHARENAWSQPAGTATTCCSADRVTRSLTCHGFCEQDAYSRAAGTVQSELLCWQGDVHSAACVLLVMVADHTGRQFARLPRSVISCKACSVGWVTVNMCSICKLEHFGYMVHADVPLARVQASAWARLICRASGHACRYHAMLYASYQLT